MDVLERMTNKFQNITVEGSDKDPTGIEKAGNNLLVGIGNVLDANAVKADTNNKKDETSEESSKVNLTKVTNFYSRFIIPLSVDQFAAATFPTRQFPPAFEPLNDSLCDQ